MTNILITNIVPSLFLSDFFVLSVYIRRFRLLAIAAVPASTLKADIY